MKEIAGWIATGLFVVVVFLADLWIDLPRGWPVPEAFECVSRLEAQTDTTDPGFQWCGPGSSL